MGVGSLVAEVSEVAVVSGTLLVGCLVDEGGEGVVCAVE